MPIPETIPTSYVVLTSALLSGFIAYQSRKNGLETEWERERLVNSRLAGSTFPSYTWGITIDQVLIVEESGPIYRFKKFITGRMDGECAVTITYEKEHIPAQVWETEAGKEFLDTYDYDVEHTLTIENVDPITAKFVLQTVEWGDVAEFINKIIEFDKWLTRN